MSMRALLLSSILVLPTVVHAALPANFCKISADGKPTDFCALVNIFLSIMNALVVVLFGLALVVFFWGLTKAWILSAGDEKGIEAGKRIAFAGIIGLVVMSAIWGIVAFLSSGLFGGPIL